jgi:starch phosphorylase
MVRVTQRVVAYFSMEIALDPRIPTYSGGLGVLAGDTIRAAADLKVPMVGVSLLYRKGYFTQRLSSSGEQREESTIWPVEELLQEAPQRASVTVEGRKVVLRCWVYLVKGNSGFTVPVYFLDADVPENQPEDRTLTHVLYGGDARCRLAQEVILGIGGAAMLRALRYQYVRRYHMNEGHASLLTLALLDEEMDRTGQWAAGPEEIAKVREQCVFTTHTPVPAGHDAFSMDLVNRVVGRPEIAAAPELFCADGQLNLTHVGLSLSGYVNGVAKKHGEVSQRMFHSNAIDAITNGVHAATWACPAFQALFDRYIPGWRDDNGSLRHAMKIPREEIWNAHQSAKQQLIDYVNRTMAAGMDPQVLTLGFARRVASYKRAHLLFHDLERLRRIATAVGPFQVVYAGKAHPHDAEGKKLIQQVFLAKESLQPDVRVTYLENYDMELGRLLTAGSDIWLNTPVRPLEASGTSGMKAALNGVPSFSVLDGWWVEGHIEHVTGWSIGDSTYAPSEEEQTPRDAVALYEKLEQVVIPTFYRERDRFIDIMRQAIAFNGSFFNTQRMVQEYVMRAYFR